MMKVPFAVALLLLPMTATAQQEAPDPPRTLNVTGTGTVERDPERAVVTVAVESDAATAQAASQQNAQQMEAVIARLRQLGIPARDVRTVSYQLNPVYSRPTPQEGTAPRITGYRAVNMVQVTVDTLAQLGRVIDGVIDAGANRVANLSFQLRDREEARLEAIERAVSSARREAEIVARAAGQRLGEPLSISTSVMFPEPRPMPMAMEMARVAADTPIEGGTLTVQAIVNITYRLES